MKFSIFPRLWLLCFLLSPVNVNLNFRDMLFSGLSHVNVKKVTYVHFKFREKFVWIYFCNSFRIGFDYHFTHFSGFGKDPSASKFEIYAYADKLSIIGKYKVKGNIIVLPVVGQGPANLTFSNNSFFNCRLISLLIRKNVIIINVILSLLRRQCRFLHQIHS